MISSVTCVTDRDEMMNGLVYPALRSYDGSYADRRLHVAVAQVHSGGSVDENLARIERQVSAAASVGADLICFSECVLQGYGYGDDLTAEIVTRVALPIDSDPCDRIVAMAQKVNLTIVVGFFEVADGTFYNACLVAYPDGDRFCQRKHQLTETELAVGLTAGGIRRVPVIVNGVKCAVIICSDGGMDGLYERLRDEGFDYRLCPTAGGGTMAAMLHESDLDSTDGRRRYEEARICAFKSDALLDLTENQGIGFASANALGPVGASTCHVGHCMIVDNHGTMRGQISGSPILEHQQDSMIHAEIQFPKRKDIL